MNNLINWFEIPTADYERGIRFYETVFGVSLRREAMGPMQVAVFPYACPATGGAVIHGDGFAPGPAGSIIYLDGGPDLGAPLARVQDAGGKVIMPKTLLSPEIGHIALFEDSEGNRIGLHSAPLP